MVISLPLIHTLLTSSSFPSFSPRRTVFSEEKAGGLASLPLMEEIAPMAIPLVFYMLNNFFTCQDASQIKSVKSPVLGFF